VPRRATVYSIKTKLHSAGCVLGKNKSPKRQVLTEGKLDGNGTLLEARPKMSFSVLALKCGMEIVEHSLVRSF
jgi:hypothetical protein